MRLTLRTLLAYLDDTLEPAETKQIGQKVAESDTAQELIARIKQVTRRRRLTAPVATGSGVFDPNTVAEYLDNVLQADQVAEVEKTCLESDVHLAEIATAHQILTLVLGEPALVPPTAKQRMYALVQGREAIPYRRPSSATAGSESGEAIDSRADEDETLLLGLPLYRRQNAWIRWLMPLAAVLLAVVLGIALWQALPPKSPPVAGLSSSTSEKQGTSEVVPPPSVPASSKPDGRDSPSSPNKTPEEPSKGSPLPGDSKTTPAEPAKPAGEKPKQPSGEAPKPDTPVTRNPPVDKHLSVGKYVETATASPRPVLASCASEQDSWKRLSNNAPIYTGDTLVSLPGYQSKLMLDSGVELELRGSLSELVGLPLSGSTAVLHNSPGMDLDFSLLQGRIMLRNHKTNGPAQVRVRFHHEIWEIALIDPNTEVGMELWGFFPENVAFGSGEPPQANLILFVFKGRADIKIGYDKHSNVQAVPKPNKFVWNNKGKGAFGPTPLSAEEVEAVKTSWDQQPPSAANDKMTQWLNSIRQGLSEMSQLLASSAALEAASVVVPLVQVLQSDKERIHRILAVRFLGDLNAIPDVLDALDDDSPVHGDVRVAALQALQHWATQGEDQEKKLFDLNTKSGLLTKKYQINEARTIMQLLHPLTEADRGNPAMWALLIDLLRHKRVAIREIAYWHLAYWVPEGRKIPYDPAAPPSESSRAYAEWKRLIPDGEIPKNRNPSPTKQPNKPSQ